MVRVIEAEFDLTTGTAIEAEFLVENVNYIRNEHDLLQHRDYVNQHPISAITGLQTALDGLETAIEDETEAREGADTTLQQNITAEASSRAAADTTLQGNIDVVSGNLSSHTGNTNNPHSVTKAQVGLGNVNNSSDMDKPVSTAQASAINAVQDNLDDETDARTQADTALGTRIDNLALNSLTDVNTSSPTNGQALVYDTISSKWVNGTVALNQGTGISIANNTISVADPTLTNQGTGSKSVGVGKESEATQEGTTAVGHDANAKSTFGTAVGYASRATNTNTTVIGKEAKATQQRATAIGALAEATAQDAIQIGGGTNNTANTLQVKSYTLLNTSTGIIPVDRIPDITLSKISDITATATELNYVDGVTSSIQTQLNGKATIAQGEKADTALQPDDVVNNVTTSTTNVPLSANMGKELQQQINNLKSIGRFLALWNCATGLAESDPTTSPRPYNTGDYFVVGVIATGSANNYKPSGSEYVTGQASTVIETSDVKVNDVYFYDGTNWTLQVNHGGLETVSFSNITGQPSDNTNLNTALNEKVTKNADITGATKTKITYDSKGLVTGGADLASSDVTTALGYIPYNATNPNGYQNATQVNTAITGYHDSTKADVDDLGTLAYADAITNGDISGTINQDKITNLTTDLGNKVTKNADITGATKCKITYDSKGLVTAGADLSASDIPNLSLSKITDVTASATEVNVLDGITATTIELNYCDGVTSNIQTQLNGKQGTLPTLQSGKYLTNNGTTLSWASVDALPSQSGQSGKFLTTDGTTASWDYNSTNKIGEIIQVACTADYIPDGCLPCDGAEYTKAQFLQLWTNYLTSSPAKLLTCSYADYTTAISTYGYCDKIAIDTTNNKFKVPTLNNKVYQGFNSTSTIPVKGNGMGLGVTDGSNTGVIGSSASSNTLQGCIVANKTLPFNIGSSSMSSGRAAYGITTNASESGIIADSSSINTKEAIDIRFFIVVSNGQINQASMDWSQWATGLASKANTNLSNVLEADARTKAGTRIWTSNEYDLSTDANLVISHNLGIASPLKAIAIPYFKFVEDTEGYLIGDIISNAVMVAIFYMPSSEYASSDGYGSFLNLYENTVMIPKIRSATNSLLIYNKSTGDRKMIASSKVKVFVKIIY